MGEGSSLLAKVRFRPCEITGFRRGLSTSLVADRGCPLRAPYQTERMTLRVGVHPLSTRQTTGPQLKNLWLGHFDVVDHDVEVELLLVIGVGPLRWLMVGCELECDARRSIVGRDHNPVLLLPDDGHPDEVCIEGCERRGIAAVDDHVVEGPIIGQSCHANDPASVVELLRGDCPGRIRSRTPAGAGLGLLDPDGPGRGPILIYPECSMPTARS